MENYRTALLLACTAILSLPSFAMEDSIYLTTIVEPEPIKRIHPKYPVKAVREQRSGWTKFSFVVEKDGSVSNIIEIGSSGSKDFTAAAKRAIQNWQYSPAMENGEPIQQCLNTVQLDFQMQDGKDGVRRRFRKKYTLATEALTAQDYPRLEQLIAELNEFDYRYVAESNYLHTISALYAEAMGDKNKQLQHLTNINFINDDKKSSDYQFSILNSRFALAVELNHFQSAYNVYKKLVKFEQLQANRSEYDKIIKKIDALIASEQDFFVAGNLMENEYWSHALVRNEFSLTNISGNLTKLDVRCANKRHVFTVENNNTWKIPDTWKNCNVFVYGENNSHFQLIEHPNKT